MSCSLVGQQRLGQRREELLQHVGDDVRAAAGRRQEAAVRILEAVQQERDLRAGLPVSELPVSSGLCSWTSIAAWACANTF